VGDSGRELADRGELRVEPRLPFELLHLGQVLEEEERPLLVPGVLQDPAREAENATLVASRDLDLVAVRLGAASMRAQLVPVLGEAESDLRKEAAGSAVRGPRRAAAHRRGSGT
jgi:hypothetical protein